MSNKKNLDGLVHAYFGDGKGKTTASIGLGVRAALAGYDVCMLQFMKGQSYSEEKIPQYIPNFDMFKYGTKDFVGTPKKSDKDLAKKGLKHAEKAFAKYDVVILDEINYAMQMGLLPADDVVDLIKKKPKDVELILTGGMSIPKKVRDLCDYASMICCVKHPFQKGINARKGIEY